jgi:23S rRNA pseudouridine1911/1915/1917 synthase
MTEARLESFTVDAGAVGQRLDRYLATVVAGVSRSRIQALIEAGEATVNGAAVADSGYRLKVGDVLALAVPPPVAAEPQAEAIPLDVVYEDAYLIVIDKPAGLVVHPAAGHASGTLVNALIAHCGDSLSGIGGVKRPGIVHRLDRDTTGLMVVAKTDAAHAGLAEQFAIHGRDGRLEREYVAVVWGALRTATGTIDAPIARSQANRTRMQVMPKDGRARIGQGGRRIEPGDEDDDFDDERAGPRAAREAITHYRVVETFDGAPAPGRAPVPLASLVRVSLETGRTHQIRVHMAHIGHPVLGDPSYGAHFKASERRLTEPQAAALQYLGRQALHAAVLGFEHPVTGEVLHFESDLPDDLDDLIDALRPPTKAKPPTMGGRRKKQAPAAPKGIMLPKRRKSAEDDVDGDLDDDGDLNG